MRHALRLGLLVALALAVSACSGGGDEHKQAEEQARGLPLPKYERASLPGGEYHTTEFKPSISLRLTGDGWRFEGPSGTLGDPEHADYLFIENEPAEIGFLNLRKVEGLADPTGPPGAMDRMPAPDELLDWFQQHPYLKTSKPEPTTVGGVEGEQFDAVVANLPKGHIALGGTGSVDLVKISTGGSAEIHEGYKARFIVLDNVKGTPMLIDFGSLIADFDEFEPKAEKVPQSVKWTGT
jgi:hypothetical protein